MNFTPTEIDQIIKLSRQRRASPEDKAFIGAMGGKLGLNICLSCPSSLRQGFDRIVRDAHKDKAELDETIRLQTLELEERLLSESDQKSEAEKTILSLEINSDCIHCLYKTDVNLLTDAQRTRLINEVSTRCGVNLLNCSSCTSDLIRGQDLLREHMSKITQHPA